jgi:hypothetical protein
MDSVMGDAGMMMPGMEGMVGVQGMVMKKADIALFRFFDFTVQPGKHYRYRVRLTLANPNYGISARYLDREELAKDRYIETDWSEPTDVISVPRDSRLLVGPVKSSRYVTVEPSATVMLIHFDEMTGDESSVEKAEILRGQLANYIEEIEKKPPPGTMLGMDAMMMDAAGGADAMMPGPPGPRPRQRERRTNQPEVEKEKIEYRTGQLVLDMTGGDSLPGRDRDLTEPGKVLLFDADGNLVVRIELNDLDEFSRYHKPEEPKKKKPEDMMMDGMMPDGMMPAMEGMEQPRGRRRGR